MRRLFIQIAFGTLVLSIPFGAAAQQGRQIIELFMQQAEQEIQRQRHLEYERRRQQELHRLHQQFQGDWRSCFQNQIDACDAALQYPGLSYGDRQRLAGKRAQIISEQREAEERARRDRYEAELQERRRIEEQEERERRARLAAEEEKRRQQLEQERRAEEERARVQARLRADAERLKQEREQEERRIAELRAFSSAREACRRHDIAACDAALQSSLGTSQDQADLREWRTTAAKLVTDLKDCEQKLVAACEAALASPALAPENRTKVLGWRAEASPWHRTLAYMSGSVNAVARLPLSTQITSTIAAVLGLTLLLTATRQRAVHADGTRSASFRFAIDFDRWMRVIRRRLRRAAVHRVARARKSRLSQPAAVASEKPKSSMPAVIERDTPAAIEALELAFAYIEEVRNQDTPAIDDKATLKDHLNTLSLAAKQIALAEKRDPDAILEVEIDGDVRTFTINELKAVALYIEGATYQPFDTRRAVPALRAAIAADPSNPNSYYLLGLIHFANHNKLEAVEALKRATELNPKNLEYRKSLDRAESLTGTQIAGYKAVRAGERVFDAGIKTANAGIMVWNVFAITWNIITFPMRLVLRIAGVIR